MNITKFSLQHARLIWFLILVLIGYGCYLFVNQPSREDPPITIRSAVIITTHSGLSTRQIERLVTEKIENKLRGVADIGEIKSLSQPGLSVIRFTVNNDIKVLEPIWVNVRNKLNEVKKELPDGTAQPVLNDSYGDVYVATIAVSGERYSHEEIKSQAKLIRDKLYKIKSVAKIELHGERRREIYLETTNSHLSTMGDMPHQALSNLKKQNANHSNGLIITKKNNINIEVKGQFTDIDNIRKMPVVNANHETSRLQDIYTIKQGYQYPSKRLVLHNGRPAVILAVLLRPHSNILDFGEELKHQLIEINSKLPIGMHVDIATLQATEVAKARQDFTLSLYQTIIIVLAVVMFFLGVRTGFLVGLTIPLALLLGFIGMSLLQIDLHRISVAALIISLGLLVDNCIVIAEDIRIRIMDGSNRYDAAVAASKNLSIPLLTSTCTTLLMFVPMILVNNQTGEFTRALPLVLGVTLLGSWVLAVTVIPVLCNVIQPGNSKTPFLTIFSRVEKLYMVVLRKGLQYKFIVFLLCIGAILLAGVLYPSLSKRFIPESERNQYMVFLQLPNDVSAEQTLKNTEILAKWLNNKEINPGITSTTSYVGYGGVRFYLTLEPFDDDHTRSVILVNTKDHNSIAKLIRKTQNFVANNLPNVQAESKRLWFGSKEPDVLKIRLSGPDSKVLFQNAQRIKAMLRKIKYTKHIQEDWGGFVPKWVINVDQGKARHANVSSVDISNALTEFYQGKSISNYRLKDELIPIRLRAADIERKDSKSLPTIGIYSSVNKRSVPLASIADIYMTHDLARIRHYEFERTITISGKNEHIGSSGLERRLRSQLPKLGLSSEYTINYGGEIATSKESKGSLFKYMPLCALMILAIFIVQFNSFRKTLIIILTVPLAVAGGLVGVAILHADFGFMAMLGVFSLSGIILNHGIVLIESISQKEIDNEYCQYALIEACARRLKPIIITTVSTILGLIPLAFFGGALWLGLTAVIMFGLGFGTFATLFFLPVVYDMFFSNKQLDSEVSDV